MNHRQVMKNQRCELLQQLGFTIEHEDSVVSFKGQEFDFSATECDIQSLVYTALTEMFKKGQATGRASVVQDFRNLLDLGDQE